MPFMVLVAVLLAGTGNAQRAAEPTSVQSLLEVRSYQLRPGARQAFHNRFERESLPLLKKAGIDVVAYGPSLHDDDSYYLMRAFRDLDTRSRQEDAFYNSAAWRDGPRSAVMAAIVTYATTVVGVDADTLQRLRRTMTNRVVNASAEDLAALVHLNQAYIDAVKMSDVRRFEELLGDDFLCTLPDGALVDRAQFLEHTAKPYLLINLQAHDVNVRLLGDVAIVHGRTTFALPGGTPGSGRYTDIWVRRNGKWVAVAAHVTRR